MLNDLTLPQAFCYFRMGLATGLVEIPELIAWADQQILSQPDPPDELFELSLAGRKPHSQLIYMLNAFQGAPDYGRPLDWLLARARQRLDEKPAAAAEIIMSLRLLTAETHLPPAVRYALFRLDERLELADQELCSQAELAQALRQFLEAASSHTLSVPNNEIDDTGSARNRILLENRNILRSSSDE